MSPVSPGIILKQKELLEIEYAPTTLQDKSWQYNCEIFVHGLLSKCQT